MSNYILDRLLEPSTLRGILWIATGAMAFAMRDNPDQVAMILASGATTIGGIGAVLPDKLNKK